MEAAEHADGDWMAKVERVDAGFTRLSSSWLPFRLPDAGKGMEGLTCVVRDGVAHLLAICEGNRCQGGKDGRRPGGGRIQVFTPSGNDWTHSATINLPEYLWFVDHSSVSVSGRPHRGDVAGIVGAVAGPAGAGQLADRRRRHCLRIPRETPAGSSTAWSRESRFIDENRFVVVSDRAKSSAPGRCRDKQQSVHIFALPG